MTRIQCIGIGNAGCKIVDQLAEEDLANVRTHCLNTDAQALEAVSSRKTLLGEKLTRGLSTGSDTELGAKVFKEDREKLLPILRDTDLLFIVAGLGGGTGTAIAHELAALARKQGALVMTFAVLPFSSEGQQRRRIAESYLQQLRCVCNAVITLPNDLLMQAIDPKDTLLKAFEKADSWVIRAIHSIHAILFNVGLMNLDFAAIQKLFQRTGGRTLFGIAKGYDVKNALQQLEMCPLLHSPEHARHADQLLINIIGGRKLSLSDVNTITSKLNERFSNSHETRIGAVMQDDWEEEIEICVMGTTGLGVQEHSMRPSYSAQEVQVQGKQEQPAEAQDAAEAPKKKKKSSVKDKFQQAFFNFDGSQAKAQGADNKEDFFKQTQSSFWQGEDLDVPTYLRKGIKIEL